MQYQPETDKAVMINVSDMATPRPLLFTEDAQIQRTRKSLLILLGVCLAFSVVGLLLDLYEPLPQDQAYDDTLQGWVVGRSIVVLLFYIFGIIAAHRYYPIGLRVFALLGVVVLILIGIAAIRILWMVIRAVALFARRDHVQHKEVMITRSTAFVFTIGICAVKFVLNLLILKFAFKLVRLINATKKPTVGQA